MQITKILRLFVYSASRQKACLGKSIHPSCQSLTFNFCYKKTGYRPSTNRRDTGVTKVSHTKVPLFTSEAKVYIIQRPSRPEHLIKNRGKILTTGVQNTVLAKFASKANHCELDVLMIPKLFEIFNMPSVACMALRNEYIEQFCKEEEEQVNNEYSLKVRKHEKIQEVTTHQAVHLPIELHLDKTYDVFNSLNSTITSAISRSIALSSRLASRALVTNSSRVSFRVATARRYSFKKRSAFMFFT